MTIVALNCINHNEIEAAVRFASNRGIQVRIEFEPVIEAKKVGRKPAKAKVAKAVKTEAKVEAKVEPQKSAVRRGRPKKVSGAVLPDDDAIKTTD